MQHRPATGLLLSRALASDRGGVDSAADLSRPRVCSIPARLCGRRARPRSPACRAAFSRWARAGRSRFPWPGIRSPSSRIHTPLGDLEAHRGDAEAEQATSSAATIFPTVFHFLLAVRFMPRNVAPGCGPVAPRNHVAPSFSGTNSPIGSRRRPSPHTFSGRRADLLDTLTCQPWNPALSSVHCKRHSCGITLKSLLTPPRIL